MILRGLLTPRIGTLDKVEGVSSIDRVEGTLEVLCEVLPCNEDLFLRFVSHIEHEVGDGFELLATDSAVLGLVLHEDSRLFDLRSLVLWVLVGNGEGLRGLHSVDVHVSCLHVLLDSGGTLTLSCHVLESVPSIVEERSNSRKLLSQRLECNRFTVMLDDSIEDVFELGKVVCMGLDNGHGVFLGVPEGDLLKSFVVNFTVRRGFGFGFGCCFNFCFSFFRLVE